MTARFGIVTAEFGNVTDHFGDVTDDVLMAAWAEGGSRPVNRSVLALRMNHCWGLASRHLPESQCPNHEWTYA